MASRSRLLPALCTPQGLTSAEGSPAFSGGLSGPRGRAQSLSQNQVRFFLIFVLKFARTCWFSLLQIERSQTCPLANKLHTLKFRSLIRGDFTQWSALPCLLCVTLSLGQKSCIIRVFRASAPKAKAKQKECC